jgi:ribonucleotide monophosphatase NagD (HAD superfamily)
MEVLAVCPTRAKERWIDDKTKDEEFKGADTEVFFYRDTMVLGVQGHPEYKNYSEFTQYVLGTMVECFASHPDCHFVRPNGKTGPMYLRIKPEILAERNARSGKTRPTFA